MRCLDVGCGGGDVTFDLASLVGITGSVVGLDLDATKIELARGDAEQAEVSNVEFRVADLTDGLGEDAYDVVYARFVLTHLADPEAGARRDGAAPCGPAAGWSSRTSTTTASFCHPALGGVRRRTTRSTRRRRCATAATPTSAGACRRCLLDAGFERVQPSIAQPAGIEGEVKLLPPLTVENIKAMVVKHGVASGRGGRRRGRRAVRARPRPTTFMVRPRIVQAGATSRLTGSTARDPR